MIRNNEVNTAKLANTDAMMSTFVNSSIEKFYTVDKLVADYMLSKDKILLNNARSVNNSVSTVNVMDKNQKNYNTIYLAYLEDDKAVTESQISDLRDLAVLCPFTEGTSVYQARALLRNYDQVVYSNDCEQTLPENNALMATGIKLDTKTEPSINVYPNPAGNEVFIVSDMEGAKIQILDITGRLVLSTDLSANTKLDVTELKSGTYFYKIMKDKVQVKTDKLIIIK